MGKKVGLRVGVLCFLLYLVSMFAGTTAAQEGACPFSTVIGNANSAFDITWTSGTTISADPNTGVSVCVSGTAPYTWQVVEGSGFSFQQTATQDNCNTLSLNGNACGSAEILVTDNFGTSVTGYMRSTSGTWVNNETLCHPPDQLNGESWFSRAEGNIRYRVHLVGGEENCNDCSGNVYCWENHFEPIEYLFLDQAEHPDGVPAYLELDCQVIDDQCDKVYGVAEGGGWGTPNKVVQVSTEIWVCQY